MRAALTGAVLGAATFLLTLASLALLYTVPLPLGPGSFAGLAYFGAPWLIVNSALGAYAAQAMASGAGRLHTP